MTVAGGRQACTGRINRTGPEADKQLVYKSKETPLETLREHAIYPYGQSIWTYFHE